METKTNQKSSVMKTENPRVEFLTGHALAIVAVVAGTAMAIGVPAVVLGLGSNLSPQMQLWLVVLAVCFGGVTSLTAAFFGTVMPSSVAGSWGPPTESAEENEPQSEA